MKASVLEVVVRDCDLALSERITRNRGCLGKTWNVCRRWGSEESHTAKLFVGCWKGARYSLQEHMTSVSRVENMQELYSPLTRGST